MPLPVDFMSPTRRDRAMSDLPPGESSDEAHHTHHPHRVELPPSRIPANEDVAPHSSRAARRFNQTHNLSLDTERAARSRSSNHTKHLPQVDGKSSRSASKHSAERSTPGSGSLGVLSPPTANPPSNFVPSSAGYKKMIWHGSLHPRIIKVFCDGTWCDRDIQYTEASIRQCNVYALYKACKMKEDELLKKIDAGQMKEDDGPIRIEKSKYYGGPGTSRWNETYIQSWTHGLVGVVNGSGLEKIIMKIWHDIVLEWREGDEICFFGFSRGAFVVRVLAQLIGHFGCDKKFLDHQVMLEQINRLLALDKAHRTLAHTEYKQDILLLACFDTVGGIGWPDVACGATGSYMGFTCSHVGNNVKHAFHAIAIDETNDSLKPVYMHQPHWDVKLRRSNIIQCFFQGVHSDAGSYTKLGRHALFWMATQIAALNIIHISMTKLKNYAIIMEPSFEHQEFGSWKEARFGPGPPGTSWSRRLLPQATDYGVNIVHYLSNSAETDPKCHQPARPLATKAIIQRYIIEGKVTRPHEAELAAGTYYENEWSEKHVEKDQFHPRSRGTVEGPQGGGIGGVGGIMGRFLGFQSIGHNTFPRRHRLRVYGCDSLLYPPIQSLQYN
ncbi:hypothetical protein T439DRAFT_358611 [Meredithblackwellia eburnea MCA 4105]